jgi:RHS repeat-associated protein
VTGGTNLTVGYYANDLVASQTQSSTTQTWTLDQTQQRFRCYTQVAGGCATATTHVNHYDDASSDSPDWITESADGANWTANITDMLGSLAATVDQAGLATLQYANLHGDVQATASSTASLPTIAASYAEFGAPQSAGSGRYGWLGGKQRSAEDVGGLTLIGVRVYDPITGRFLQTDPIKGGSANDYDYADQDPVNEMDLDGRGPVCTCNEPNDSIYTGGRGWGGEAEEPTPGRGASSAAEGIRLARQLASEEQVAMKYKTVLAGRGSRVKISYRTLRRLVKSYGGKNSDWRKLSSAEYEGRDGTKFQTHWYENVRRPGVKYELKTKFTRRTRYS